MNYAFVVRTALALAATSLSPVALRAQRPATELSVAGRSSANPTVAAEGNFVAVVWSAATVSSMDLFLATSKDAGATFSAPVQVNQVAGDARVSGENPARVALVPRQGTTPEVIVVWTTRAGSTCRSFVGQRRAKHESAAARRAHEGLAALPFAHAAQAVDSDARAAGAKGNDFVWGQHDGVREHLRPGVQHHQVKSSQASLLPGMRCNRASIASALFDRATSASARSTARCLASWMASGMVSCMVA